MDDVRVWVLCRHDGANAATLVDAAPTSERVKDLDSCMVELLLLLVISGVGQTWRSLLGL